MQRQIMIDFETFGLSENAVLVALGAVAFEGSNIVGQFYAPIDPRTQPGRTIDPSTVLWWLDQSDKARSAITNSVAAHDKIDAGLPEDMDPALVDTLYAESAYTLHQVARSFIGWAETLGDLDQLCAWSNGAVDHAWLNSMYAYTGFVNPIKFYNQRDYRTVKAMYPHIQAEQYGVAHNALDDAIKQTKHLIHLLEINTEAHSGLNMPTQGVLQ